MTDVVDLFTVTIAGREITCKRAGAGQLIMIRKLIRAMHRDGEEVFNTMERVLNVAEKLIINQDDRDHVVEAMLNGDIDFSDIMPIIAGGKADDDVKPDDDEKPARAKAPASLTAKRPAAAKKTAAKKTANPRRVAR